MFTKKAFISFLVLWHGFNIFVEGYPGFCLLQENFAWNLREYMNVVGQWQGSLAFFSPSPDNLNLHLEADFEFTDGTKAHWRSPEWSKLTVSQKFLSVRHIKYFDNVRRDDNKGAWEDLALYLTREQEATGKKVRHVELSRHWVDVPPPKSNWYNAMEDLPHNQVYTFYRKDFT
jgi:hypothetical protein